MEISSVFKTNDRQSAISKDMLDTLPQELVDNYYEFMTSVPFIQNMISPNRKYAKDLERDSLGRIVVDVINPHILEDMDYFRPSAIHYQKYGCFTFLRPNGNPNSKFMKWFMEEIRRCRDGYIRDNDGEWVTGDMYFYLNYNQILLSKKDKDGKSLRVEDFPRVWDTTYLVSHYLYQCRKEGKHFLELASRGKGKAHPYSEKVWTPYRGLCYWEDIEVGDYLFDERGKPTQVIDIPYDGVDIVYEIKVKTAPGIFVYVRCTENHEWQLKNGEVISTNLLSRFLSEDNEFIRGLFLELPFGTKSVKYGFSSNEERNNVHRFPYKKYSPTIVGMKRLPGKERCKCVTVDSHNNLYMIGEGIVTHNSFFGASLLAKRFILGESKEVNKRVNSMVTASEAQYIKGGSKVLDMFQNVIDFLADNTQFPRRRLYSSLDKMNWVMGYEDAVTGTKKGTLNSVQGVTANSNEGKLRGSRGVLYILEEMGTFARLLGLYNTLRPSVEDGDDVWGTIMLIGCVCEGTKVLTSEGVFKNIEDVQIGEKLKSYTDKEREEIVSWLSPYAKKECYRIHTERGEYIDCSYDHPLLVGCNYNKNATFKRVEDLEVGDMLMSPKKFGTFGDINEPDAFLLGALFGDGSYDSKTAVPSLSISSNEEYDYYNSKYKVGMSKLYTDKTLYAQLYFTTRETMLLKKYGMYGQTKEYKRFPNNIHLWNKKSVCDFIAGYFNADGNVQKRGGYRIIKLCCKYKEPLEHMKILLWKLGITSYIMKEHSKASVGWSNVNNREIKIKESYAYYLYINNAKDVTLFKDNIHLLIKKKQERLDTYVDTFKNLHLYNPIFVTSDNGKCRNLEGMQLGTMKGYRITKIEPLGIKRIYNLTADTTHSYVTNRFISANTAGDSESDFAAAQEMMYNPIGYNIKALPNVFDKAGQGKQHFGLFIGAYMNRANCYDENGNSDVTRAVLEILRNRYKIKYNITDMNTLVRNMAEYPITPQEAVIRVQGNLFPSTDLTERLHQIDQDVSFYDSVYVGDLVYADSGIVFRPSNTKEPIRDFPFKGNDSTGCIEIYNMPESDSNNKIPQDRYIIGQDPYDSDQTNSSVSLGSVFVFDMWTDNIVAEYTGRPMFVNDFFEISVKLAKFYNAKINYENNKKGMFTYCSTQNCLYLLTDTFEYLKDKQLIKANTVGNSSKGTLANQAINNYARRLVRDWLITLKQTTSKNDKGELVETEISNLYFLKSRAAIKELIAWNPEGNFDRVSALGMVMLYREHLLVLYGGNVQEGTQEPEDYLGNDDFFKRNYKRKK